MKLIGHAFTENWIWWFLGLFWPVVGQLWFLGKFVWESAWAKTIRDIVFGSVYSRGSPDCGLDFELDELW